MKVEELEVDRLTSLYVLILLICVCIMEDMAENVVKLSEYGV